MWNGGTGGSNNSNDRRYEDGGGGEHRPHPHSSRTSHEMDPQQMAAVSALAGFSQAAGGFAPAQQSMFAAAQQLGRSSLAREYSDSALSSGSAEYARQQQQQNYAQHPYYQSEAATARGAFSGDFNATNYASVAEAALGAYQQQLAVEQRAAKPYKHRQQQHEEQQYEGGTGESTYTRASPGSGYSDLEIAYKRPSASSSSSIQQEAAGYRRPSPSYDELLQQERQFAAARYQSEGHGSAGGAVDYLTQQRSYQNHQEQMHHLSQQPEQNISLLTQHLQHQEQSQLGSRHSPANNTHNHHDPQPQTNGSTSSAERSTHGFALNHHHHDRREERVADKREQFERKLLSEPPSSSNVKSTPQIVAPRGKPEAMAKALAASRIEAERKELEALEEEEQKSTAITGSATTPKAKPPASKKSPKRNTAASSKKSSPKKSATSSSSSSRKHALPASASVLYAGSAPRRELLLNEKAPPIKEAEYENLKELMKQFCRVPLLAEFSRPVGLLHPELAAVYSKIVQHPVDLGHVCRGIRRHQYKTCRDVRLDMWRVFANCVKFHSDPNNKEAVPSFVSIALHLREYFNNLWQEYMLPSDLPPPPANTNDEDAAAAYEVVKAVIAKRDEDRRKRLENSGVLILSQQFTKTIAGLLLNFIENGGCVDKLDEEPIFGESSGLNDKELDVVVQRLQNYQRKLESVSQTASEEYSLDSFYTELRDCYTKDVLEENPSLRNRIASRLNRFFWKQSVVLHEANSRGVTQSSIWGNIAATIWARESSKKPYWPALCLGILPPADQREGWHDAVTERNEGRLPEKLRSQLMTAKRRCEHAQKRQSLSYFLVEFLGTHEFIWVRETDIVENFDAKEDPNKAVKPGTKKGRSSRSSAASIIGTETYQRALQECEWANEEFENILQDAFEYTSDDDTEDDDDEEMNYSFAVLSQSDDEADHEDSHGYLYTEDGMDMSDVDEANWLLSHDGLLDTSPAGRKNAKKRTQAMKKKASSKDKKEDSTTKKRSKSKEKKKDPKVKEREDKKEQRELVKRRKKRMREREKMLRNEARKKNKRRRSGAHDSDDDERGLNHDKRARATAIVKAYMHRLSADEDNRSLALGGVMTMPAAMVDSTGLLGMALAFRAAAGELSMPDDGKEQLAKTNPWTAIDAEKPKTSAERTDNLQKQIELLEKEIDRVRKDTEKRSSLASEYGPKRLAIAAQIEADEWAARQNHYKKKKKPAPAKTGQSVDESPEKSGTTTTPKGMRQDDDGASERIDGDDATELADDDDDMSESVNAENADNTEGVAVADEEQRSHVAEYAGHDDTVEAMEVSMES